MLEVLAATASSIVIEETGISGDGIEFSVARPNGKVEAHQVKRQSGNSNSWSITTLVGLNVIEAARSQVTLGREFHFVSVVPSRKLQELTDRSRQADSLEAFVAGLTGTLRAEFDTFTRAIGTDAEAFTVLCEFYLQVIDEVELNKTNETFARLLAIGGSSVRGVPTILAEVALDNLGRTLDTQFIRGTLRDYGLNVANVAHSPTLATALREAESARLVRLGPIADQIAKVQEIAPPGGLQAREEETAMLTKFCNNADFYLRVVGLPWAGKTALLAGFVLDPPEGVDILSFFVNGRTTTDADSSAFTDALLGQLANLLGKSTGLPPEPRERETYRRQLLAQASERASATGRKLVLVVDGLDEDRSSGRAHGQPSIASLLPADTHSGLKVLVSARMGYELPLDVLNPHPLQNCVQYFIAPSASAEAKRIKAEQELNDLLSHQDRRELLAFLAASTGGLTRDDLSALTGFPLFTISDAFAGVAARTVARTRTNLGSSFIYTFTHEELLFASKSIFGAAVLQQRRSLIEQWADRYQQADWPPETPDYLLTGYGLMLADAQSVSQMIALAIDSKRHERMLDIAEGHASALREIDTAGQMMVGKTPDNLNAALRMAIERQNVASGQRVSFAVINTWVAVDQTGRAEALARSIDNERKMTRALVVLLVALTRYRHSELAERILGTVSDPDWADNALALMAREAARWRDVPRAAQLAGRIVHRPFAENAFAAVIGAASDAGDFEWAEELLRSEIIEERPKAKAVASIVAAQARMGDPATALTRASAELNPLVRQVALDALARVIAARPDSEIFDDVLAEITDDVVVERCRAGSTGSAYARDGRHAADELIASLHGIRAKDEARIQLALALVRDDKLPEAERVIAKVQQDATNAVIALAAAVADMGDLGSAQRLADKISEREGRSQCLGGIARSAARLGRFDRAEYFAREIPKPGGVAITLAAIARESYRAGGHARGRELAVAAEEQYRDIARLGQTSSALRVMSTCLADIGDVHRAWNLLNVITNRNDRDMAAQFVGPALVRGGLAAEAESLLISVASSSRSKSTRACGHGSRICRD
jgi:hypothetical protein